MKKYRVRLVIDDVVDAPSPKEAKEFVFDLQRDGYYGTKQTLMCYNMTARRRKDLEEQP
jgi:hypothetical protein